MAAVGALRASTMKSKPCFNFPCVRCAIADAVPDLAVMTDFCLCEYTDHGHCGLLNGEEVENDGAASSGTNGKTLKEVERSDGDFDEEGNWIAAPIDKNKGGIRNYLFGHTTTPNKESTIKHESKKIFSNVRSRVDTGRSQSPPVDVSPVKSQH